MLEIFYIVVAVSVAVIAGSHVYGVKLKASREAKYDKLASEPDTNYGFEEGVSRAVHLSDETSRMQEKRTGRKLNADEKLDFAIRKAQEVCPDVAIDKIKEEILVALSRIRSRSSY